MTESEKKRKLDYYLEIKIIYIEIYINFARYISYTFIINVRVITCNEIHIIYCASSCVLYVTNQM